ncbi:type I restriction-modification system subunit M [Flavilitoribacter nigricans]|uniref:site-specific DNA-methyltransferase (adenine-specific) n=1 Tax=Flavilitoribacter nigricans (strain ATCC 23147 / DSM 23189 / NBRC 102662 / NCIMB 1420 / SS-2) TaxID=1122177 RepID=A0A2D0N781_FLAN2|nr:class I SAM-dependent DNA methyltransferase [Flavilitoribacter nigricans]PHN04374.1 type I restriction endonuclease subunit M [Flavilitoribacter nigricans DSM 23189 = NBRC 102662]
MAIKKSELYSSLWKSCDELRGSMDASQYKDYVLVLLFMKYVSDKGDKLVDIPEGGSFSDMVKLKGQSDIGDKINKIIAALAKANDLNGIITVADFNDDEKLGKGKDKVDRLSNLIEIFENENLDFSSNRAENDDILGDAYEYLMRHFATESGKSKGQFYTPAEVSRVMAKVIGIEKSKSQSESIYDPTCGSGSLLLKAADEAPHGISIYGQENDNATRALAVMNMWLHGNPASEIVQGNTLANPLFKDDTTGFLKTFDYAVANPPFSNKNWTNGLDAANDIYKRFDGYEIPPQKNGDYAFLLHLIKSLKSKGKGAIILPLGVLFRANTEAEIRKKIIQRGYIKGIIGLPANLFYGTGIAAAILVLDKEDAYHRKGIFMIDASKGYIKDGNKNRLRSQDLHKIVDVFNKQLEIAKYSRMVPLAEISDPKNGYNLNIPRYIDSKEEEDVQDIDAHLNGGIPNRDLEAMNHYWKIYPTLKNHLFKAGRPGYWDLNIGNEDIKNVIFKHPEFLAYSEVMKTVFDSWKNKNTAYLKSLEEGCYPKEVIHKIAEELLQTYHGKDLVDKYAIYQYLMDYWAETMQDDLYELSADGWKAGNVVTRLVKKSKKNGKEVEKQIAGIEGLEGQLIPPSLIIQEYLATHQATIDALQSDLDSTIDEMDEFREEHGGEDGLLTEALNDKGNITKGTLKSRQKELGKRNVENAEEFDVLKHYEKLLAKESKIKTEIKSSLAALEVKVIEQYPKLSIAEIKMLMVDKKWIAVVESRIKAKIDGISHRLTERIKELGGRYETPMPKLTKEVAELATKVELHLRQMNYKW